MIDQHALTGESTPAEKGVGDRVFASTLLVAGKILVSVEKSGSETASAKISQILNDTAGYKLSSQHKGEVLADKAVIPTLTIGAVGLATMGHSVRWPCSTATSAPASGWPPPWPCSRSLALCASKGILVKDGRALEADERGRYGPLRQDRHPDPRTTRGRPRHRQPRLTPEEILLYAAAAEKKFHHPIALAILHKAKELGLDLPDDRRHAVQGRLRHHRPHPRTHDPGWQQAVHGARRPRR